MPRLKSELLEDFAKIADNVGMFKEAYPSLESYKDDSEARMGSDDISNIEALYGVVPEGQDYEFNIMQDAHPNSVVIAPSYDKINGLVENNIERNQIMINVTLKNPTGNHTNHKYAQKELVMELVRIANEMDSRNKEDLFKLADDCLIGIHKEALSFDEIKQWLKEKAHDSGAVGEGALAGAGIGATIGGLISAWTGPGILAGVPVGAATGAAIGGLVAAFTKTAPQVKSVELNAKEVSHQLQDLYKKIPEQSDFFKAIDVALNALVQSSQDYQSVLNLVKSHQINKVVSEEEYDQHSTAAAADKFIKDVAKIKEYHAEFQRRGKSGAFAKATPGKVLAPAYWFMDNDIEDVDDAFDSLEDAIEKLELTVKQDVEKAANNAPVQQSVMSPSNSTPPSDKEKSFLEHLMSGE